MPQPFHANFDALHNALAQLTESLEFLHSELASNPKLLRQFRSATIQAFEYCYELAHKSLKRFLLQNTPSADVINEMTFADLIRTGHEKGLLQNSWSVWRLYRDARNSSSHAYSEQVANAVLQHVPAFLAEAQYLCQQLMQKTHD